MVDKTTLQETLRAIDGTEEVRLATIGANWRAPLSDIFTALHKIIIDTTPIIGGAVGNVLMHGAGNVVAEYATTGTGPVVLQNQPDLITPSMQGFEELGDELITNPSFAADTTGWEVDPVTAVWVASGELSEAWSFVQITGLLTPGLTYRATVTAPAAGGGVFVPMTVNLLINAGDTQTFDFVAGDDTFRLENEGGISVLTPLGVSCKLLSSGPAGRVLFGDGLEDALRFTAAASGPGGDPAKIFINADGDFLLIGNADGSSVGFQHSGTDTIFNAFMDTSLLTDHRRFNLPDNNGVVLTDPAVAVNIDTGVINANRPGLNLFQEWDEITEVFVGALIDITNTASDAASRAFGIDINGIEIFTVRESEMYVLGALSTDGTLFAADVQSDTFVQGTEFRVSGTKVVGAQGTAVADATGAGDVVAQLNELLSRLRPIGHGLIAA